MIREGDEDVQKIERTLKGPWIMSQSLKTNTNWMKNEEQTKNDIEVDCSRNSIAI